jgi:hypothetical protein
MSTRVRKPRPLGPKSLQGTPEAKRQATAILETLAGLCRPLDASRGLGISLMKYYLLETRALQGLLTALEPLPRGRGRSPDAEISKLQHDKQRLERELVRTQALLRAAQRTIGLTAVPVASKGSKLGGKSGGKKQRRPTVRATRAIRAMWGERGTDPSSTESASEPAAVQS